MRSENLLTCAKIELSPRFLLDIILSRCVNKKPSPYRTLQYPKTTGEIVCILVDHKNMLDCLLEPCKSLYAQYLTF